MKADICQILRDAFSYNKETGLLTRKTGQWAGHVQSAQDSRGYVITYANGKSYRAHRVIWMIYYGEPAPKVIDHINGICSDNRIENLRAATQSQNTSNRHDKPKRKHDLPKGVSKNRSRFISHIYVDGKRISYGKTFATPLEAGQAYDEMAIKYHGEFAQVNRYE